MELSTLIASGGAFLATAIASWLIGRTLKVPGKVAALEIQLKNYLPLVGTADAPGAQTLIRRVDALEHNQDRQHADIETKASEVRQQMLAECRLIRTESAAAHDNIKHQIELLNSRLENVLNEIKHQ